MRAVILVPRRDDDGWRDKLWAHCKQIWLEKYPDMEMFEGYHNEGPFNRSYAINRASEMAGDWDVALIIDSDTISDPECVRKALDLAIQSGGLVVAHTHRHMLTESATRRILAGDQGNWKRSGMVKKTWRDSVSCAVAVSRKSWDIVGGFDERFVGWGFEDTAFHIAIEAISGLPVQTIPGDCFHLHHPVSPETSRTSFTYKRNHSLKRRYEAVRWQPERILRLLGQVDDDVPIGTIPRILHRTVPEHTSDEVEKWWERFGELNPDWDLRTYREPIDPADWPMTGDLFAKCQNGAQKAGLIRLEALYSNGGVYVDSDVEPYRPLESLLNLPAFAGWEDEKVVPDAVLGAAKGHPAFMELIGRARESIEGGQGAWDSGPGGTTEILPGRDDIVIFPPGAFYPAHYLEKNKLGSSSRLPWVFMEHKWHHSWGTTAQKQQLAAKQRGARQRQREDKPKAVQPLREGPPPDVNIAVCIPWMPGDGWRQMSYDWCTAWWQSIGVPIFVGTGSSRSAMRNDAARQAFAAGADVIFFADADTWVPMDQFVTAMTTAHQTNQLTHAFTTYTRLGSKQTRAAMNEGNVDAHELSRMAQRQRNHASGAHAISKELWEKIGGYDERFETWGLEDRAFDLAADCLGGGVRRVDGPAIHWFHEHAKGKEVRIRKDQPTVHLMIRYCQAAGKIPPAGVVAALARSAVPRNAQPDPEAMLAVLSEEGGPLAGSDTKLALVAET